MNVMYSLAWRQMKLQKRRTIITILGVIVAVAMIAAVSSFAATFMNLFQRVEIESGGEWHAKIENTTAADRAQIAQDPKVRDVFVIGNHGVLKLPERQGRISQVEIFSLDAAGLDVMGVSLLSGTYPEGEGALLVNETLAKAAALEKGDSLSLLDEAGREKRFTVCGVAKMNALENVVSGRACAMMAQPEETTNSAGAQAVLRLKKLDRGVYDWLQALCEEIPGEQQYRTHTSLLIYSGVSSNDAVMNSIYMMEALIMAIILAASVTLIYNAFAISVTDRSAQFGMLASIGATMRQRRRAVLFEALTIALIAIPFGLLFGYLGIGITFSVVSDLIRDSFAASTQAELRLVISPGAVLLSVGLALATVLISAWIPAKRAARVSPMEAIRKTQDIKLSGRQVKTSPLTRAIFGFEGELAAKNLKRNKKRYRVTTLSLAMSLILFLSAYSFTYYMSYSYTTAVETVDYNLTLNASLLLQDETGKTQYGVLDRVEQEALEILSVDRAAAYTHYTRFSTFSAILPEERCGRYPYTQRMKEIMGDEFELYVQVISLDDESLADYARETGAALDALLDAANPAGILINGGNLYWGQRFEEFTALEMKAGDTLAVQGVTLVQEAGAPRRAITDEYGIRLAAVTQEYPWGMSSTLYSPMVTLVLSQRTARALMPGARPYLTVLYQTDAVEQAEEALQALQDRYSTINSVYQQEDIDALTEEGAYLFLSVSNLDAERRAVQQLNTIINIFVYGFITLLSLVAAANIVGTISTSLLLRKREFAMVKSVGMGPKAFDRMIRCESVLYGVKAIVLGLLGSVVIVFLMWRAIGQTFSAPFRLPWVQMLIGVAGIFLLVTVTMAYSVHKIRKDTIVEDLRLE